MKNISVVFFWNVSEKMKLVLFKAVHFLIFSSWIIRRLEIQSCASGFFLYQSIAFLPLTNKQVILHIKVFIFKRQKKILSASIMSKLRVMVKA